MLAIPDVLKENSNISMGLENDDDMIDKVPAGIVQKCYRECLSLIFILDDLNSEFVHITFEDYKKMPAKLLAAFKLYRHLLIIDKGKVKNREDK